MTRRGRRLPRSLSGARAFFGAALVVLAGLLAATATLAAPKVVVISLDGATPRLVDQYLASGVLSPNTGLGPCATRASPPGRT